MLKDVSSSKKQYIGEENNKCSKCTLRHFVFVALTCGIRIYPKKTNFASLRRILRPCQLSDLGKKMFSTDAYNRMKTQKN